jgi:hypothetical protein
MHARVHHIDNTVWKAMDNQRIGFRIISKDEMRHPPEFGKQRIYRFGS